MTSIKNLLRVLRGKAALFAVLPLLLVSAHTSLFAQSAEVTYAGVFYKNGESGDTVNNMYCDWRDPDADAVNFKLARTQPCFYQDTINNTTGGTTETSTCASVENDPLDVNDIRVDGDYKVQLIQKKVRTSQGNVRSNSRNYQPYQMFYAVYFVNEVTGTDADGNPTYGDVLYYDNYQVVAYASPAAGFAFDINTNSADNRSFVSREDLASGGVALPSNVNDPYVYSALIEYDQPYPSAAPAANKYPNHCLSLCMSAQCTNFPTGGSTYSIAFPIQRLTFDVVKYYNGKNIANAEETPAVRTIYLYPDTNSADNKCAAYSCIMATYGNPCAGARYECDGGKGASCTGNVTKNTDQAYVCSTGKFSATCRDLSDEGSTFSQGEYACGTLGQNCVMKDPIGKGSHRDPINFCAAWDGSYEIAGEMAKTNGNFAFRATAETNFPGDQVTVDTIEFTSVATYPGMNQIPMQVDVTNVHTVRSTPTVVGNITAVAAQPYTFAYRLSKDADVRVAVFDASNGDNLNYPANTGATAITASNLVRTIADWQPRTGEGIKGQDKDTIVSDFDSWDGRNEQGMLLPAGNYIVSIQAKAQDEWGLDFSRAVTRQMSLDPLRLTDVVVTGLNKKSTAYAQISYTPTEASKVFLEIFTPGTKFVGEDNADTVLVKTYTPTGTAPQIANTSGTLVYRSAVDRSDRMNYTARWDGLCGNDAGCKRTYAKGELMSDGTTCNTATGCTQEFAYGAPLPDGNYVYVLWAEIPYNGCYKNAAVGTPTFTPNATCTDDASSQNKQFTGVKTVNYKIGQLAIERGLVDVTIQPVSYSTVGSSPTAYGLDPFIFKYSLARDATAIAKVTNTAGVTVKYLTPENGASQVAQQLNTLSWDGRDDKGRMVTPGTYMFVVETKDAMFPAVTNKASAVFPVDMYRVVDVSTTDVYGDSEAKATITYSLSKAMNVQVNIYNKDVVIPSYNNTTGLYNEYTVNTTAMGQTYTNSLTNVSVSLGTSNVSLTGLSVGTETRVTVENATNGIYNRDTVTVKNNPDYVAGSTVENERQYIVSLTRENITITGSPNAVAWPPRVCNTDDDGTVFQNGFVDPRKNPTCIYVNDQSFTNYPNRVQANSGVVDVRLQPIKTFDRSSTRVGDGMPVTEEWDALYFYNPSAASCAGTNNLKNCPYEMLPDGQYPFFISARSNEPFDRYYAKNERGYLVGAPFKTDAEVVQENYLYATEKPTGKINVTRGPVYFLDGSTVVYPNAPQLFNTSSGPIFVPPYEINFSVSRAATVEVAIVALQPNVCNPDPSVRQDLKNNRAGDVCKYLSTMTIVNTGNFDPNISRKIYWDGTDNNGFYVKSGIYEVRLTARNYPNPDMYQETVKSITLNADLLKVFDLLEADGYAISQRGTDMKIGYQISVPMKVAIQIFKPGTTIYDYQKGTLRNPTTGQEVKDIHEVLVRAIVGIRPATTLIEELWDGRDYAQQEVPDGTYPFRFVTALNSADIDSVTGEILGSDDTSTDMAKWSINKVADTYEYQNLHKSTIAVGDGRFVCEDWEKTVFFYPNPLRDASKGTLEITKMPVPGEVSIKFFDLAGVLVRDSNYTCVDANNYQVTMGSSLEFNPDNTPNGATAMDATTLATFPNVRNAALRCRWNRTNQHGKKVARGVYFGVVDFKAKNGREHCQKVVKVLVP